MENYPDKDLLKVTNISIDRGAIQKRYELYHFLESLKKNSLKVVMEIGSAKGGTLFGISQIADKDAIIISVDLPGGGYGGGYDINGMRIMNEFKREGQIFHFVRRNSHAEATFKLIESILGGKKLDLLFIDGDHTYEGVKQDFDMYKQFVREGGIVAFHDILEHPKELNCHVDKLWVEVKDKYPSQEFIDPEVKNWGGIGMVNLIEKSTYRFKKRLPEFLFIHESINGQHRELFNYLNENNLARVSYLCSESDRFNNQFVYDNIYGFEREKIENDTYYFSSTTKEHALISKGIFNELNKMVLNKHLDLIFTHYCYGSPVLWFNHIDIPIVSYIEFPSFSKLGWDLNYNPNPDQIIQDNNFEMLSYYSLIRSDATIVPSEYAKSLLPIDLRHKATVIMEGFSDAKILNYQTSENNIINKEDGFKYIGFTARTLSTEKGFEQFIKIAKNIIQKRQNVKFVVIGSANNSLGSYGFESNYLPSNMDFKNYVLNKHGLSNEHFIFYEFLDYPDFIKLVEQIDFFIYPLQFGVATWGFFELALRGKILVCSNHKFIPEIIKNDFNGFLIDYNDLDGWVNRCIELIDNMNSYVHIGENIKKTGEAYLMSKRADVYMKFFNKVIETNIRKGYGSRRINF